ncbi:MULTISPECIES: Mov34/MPN/PAD-1 family protein [Acinetobacter]|uniref:CBASS system CD-NTase/cGAS isopeptidase Cap3 n=1 Tax=Acinetobacter TaxID=469 RepID=UPI00064731DF|nr:MULTISPECIES: Mov34/MPN/PAD-1 family protein [Acinetobacter]MCW3177769.1 Mov34/MPN/PAD-1 family protein [Acinetobacter baumannii]RZH03309.1 peptidase [Acinetobacter pittii]
MLNNELIFKSNDESLVIVMPEVISDLVSHRQLTPTSKEAAGVLIGERRGPHIVIWTISLPSDEDIRDRFSVDRVGKHHQNVVDQAFQKSKGTWQYIGEWHTHPEDAPSPSPTDINSWRTNLFSNEELILIIVGRTNFWVGKQLFQELNALQQV